MELDFWIKDPKILYENNNYLKFIPTLKMSRIEQLNAISRLCIYYIILLLCFSKNTKYLGLPIIILILVVIIYVIFKYDKNISDQSDYFDKTVHNNVIKKVKSLSGLESGHYDSAGKLRMGKFNNNSKQNIIDRTAKDFVNYDFNELLEYENQSCKRPTQDNPFMNPPITNLNKEDIQGVVACNADDADINNDIEREFNVDLYKDLTDLYDTKNSQRIWYTVPSTAMPNDQEGFANWLYKTDNCCKTNQMACLRYEDIRYKK